MGRKKNTSLKVKGLFIYPTLLRQVSDDPEKDYRGIIIRVTDKKKISMDVECYDDSTPRVRIRSRPDFWFKDETTEGKITGGYSEDTVNRLNVCLIRVQSDVAKYVELNEYINKPLLMAHVYGEAFAKTAKKRRLKYVTIPIHSEGRIIDSYELTNNEIDKLLNPLVEKRTFINSKLNSDGTLTPDEPKTVEGVFDSETGESMIESIDDVHELINEAKTSEKHHEDYERAKKEMLSRPTAERFLLGQYNKKDICEVFALSYYDPKITNDYYTKIVIRLFEYKERNKGMVSTNVKDFNLDWIIRYFTWFEENGYYRINTKGFDPLKYDPNIFYKITDPQQRTPYKGKSVEKNVNMFKSITKKLQTRNLLPKVEGLDEFSFEDITKKKSRKGTRKEMALNKEELDTIFHLRIETSDLKECEKIFRSMYDKYKKPITVTDLLNAREMFITQVMAGGLRGWHDLKTCSIRKHSQKLNKVTFKVGKKDDAIENPTNDYLEAVLKRNGNKLPFIDDENLYAALIRTVVVHIGTTVAEFDREIKPDKYVNQYEKVYDVFRHGYFARKTFAQVLSSLGLRPDQIEMFTGHEKEDREITASYLDENTIENKAKLVSKLRIGKGLE